MVSYVQGKFHWSRVDIFLDSRETRDRPRYSASTLHITLVRLYAHGTKRSLYTASFYVHRKNAKQACTSAHTSAYTCTRDSRAVAAMGPGRRSGGGRLPRTATPLSTCSDIIDKRLDVSNWQRRKEYINAAHLPKRCRGEEKCNEHRCKNKEGETEAGRGGQRSEENR